MDKEKAKEAIREYFTGHIYVCTRDSSAWGYGTMGLDDFDPASEDDDIVTDVVDIVAQALGFC